MNFIHNWLCRSESWRTRLQDQILPWALYGLDLGPAVLEVGPGYGMATDVIRRTAPRVVSVEIDRRLARLLARRLAGSNTSVIRGDGTALPFRDESFTGAVCFTMLHHLPSPQLQDRLIAEVCRVLRPGAVFAGSDSLWSRRMKWLHVHDTLVPIDPEKFAARLAAAGFADIDISIKPAIFRFRARRRP